MNAELLGGGVSPNLPPKGKDWANGGGISNIGVYMHESNKQACLLNQKIQEMLDGLNDCDRVISCFTAGAGISISPTGEISWSGPDVSLNGITLANGILVGTDDSGEAYPVNLISTQAGQLIKVGTDGALFLECSDIAACIPATTHSVELVGNILTSTVNGVADNVSLTAANVLFDPSISSLTATDVQAAIEELNGLTHPDDDVETVTGTAVDNTDPRNPVINLEDIIDNDLTVVGGKIGVGAPLVRNTNTTLSGFDRTWTGTDGYVKLNPSTGDKLEIRQENVDQLLYGLDIASFTKGARILQASTLGGNSNVFEPDYPTLELVRGSSTRGADLAIGRSGTTYHIASNGSQLAIYDELALIPSFKIDSERLSFGIADADLTSTGQSAHFNFKYETDNTATTEPSPGLIDGMEIYNSFGGVGASTNLFLRSFAGVQGGQDGIQMSSVAQSNDNSDYTIKHLRSANADRTYVYLDTSAGNWIYDSQIANYSGLTLAQINNTTPSTAGAKALGVDATGLVVTIDAPTGGNNIIDDTLYDNDLTVVGGNLGVGAPLVRETLTALSGFNRTWNGADAFTRIKSDGNIITESNAGNVSAELFARSSVAALVMLDDTWAYVANKSATGGLAWTGTSPTGSVTNQVDMSLRNGDLYLSSMGAPSDAPNSPTGQNAKLYVEGGATVLQNDNTDGDDILTLNATRDWTFYQEDAVTVNQDTGTVAGLAFRPRINSSGFSFQDELGRQMMNFRPAGASGQNKIYFGTTGLFYNHSTVTGAYATTGEEQHIFADSSTGDVDINLTQGAGFFSGQVVTIKRTSLLNNVNIQSVGGTNNVEGVATYIMNNTDLSSITLLNDGADWWII